MSFRIFSFVAGICLAHTVFAFNIGNNTGSNVDTGSGSTSGNTEDNSPNTITGTLGNGRYIITNVYSQKALTVASASTADGANVVQQDYNAAAHQQWDVRALGNGDYSIRAAHSGKALDVWEWNAEDGADARTWPYLNGENQHWTLQDSGQGNYSVISRFSGKALEVENASTNNNGNVALWRYVGEDTQLWTFEKVDSSTNTDTNTPLGPVNVFIAGDSTVSNYTDTARPDDQAGWGQMLPEQYNRNVRVQNHAIGGRSARRFIDEGRLNTIWNQIKAGDYLLVQFGTNDGHKTATYTLNGRTIPYYLDPNTDFKTYLKRYSDGAKARGVNLVFVTPPPRNSAYCTGGNGTGAHAQAMRELAAAEGVPVADLNRKTVDYLIGLCPAPQPERIFMIRPDGSVDGTHFQENGARILSGFVADGIGEAGLPLDQHRR